MSTTYDLHFTQNAHHGFSRVFTNNHQYEKNQRNIFDAHKINETLVFINIIIIILFPLQTTTNK